MTRGTHWTTSTLVNRTVVDRSGKAELIAILTPQATAGRQDRAIGPVSSARRACNEAAAVSTALEVADGQLLNARSVMRDGPNLRVAERELHRRDVCQVNTIEGRQRDSRCVEDLLRGESTRRTQRPEERVAPLAEPHRASATRCRRSGWPSSSACPAERRCSERFGTTPRCSRTRHHQRPGSRSS